VPTGLPDHTPGRPASIGSRASGLKPVIVSPPAGSVDSGAVAVASVVDQLDGRLPQDPSWAEALTTATHRLAATSDLLVICDEPSRWTSGEGHFAARAREALDAILAPEEGWSCISLERASTAERVVALPQTTPAALLAADHWPGFVDAARRVARRDEAAALTTPLAQRVAVAIEAWSPDIELPTTLGGLADLLASTLADSRAGRYVWAYWQRLALARVTVPGAVRDDLGLARLRTLGRETVNLVLMDGSDRLHDEFRRVATERPIDPALGDTGASEVHRLLFDYHQRRTEELSAGGDRGIAEHATEARFHATELGSSELLDLVSFELGDELNALGLRAGRRRRDYETSANLFLRALNADDEDAYAQHGRAHALDVMGRDPNEVEQRYRRALDLDPANPDWHADLVGFLLSLGRLDEARTAWSNAETATFDAGVDATTYDELHLPVATHLLALAELDFADYVLAAVPGYAQDAEYRRLAVLLTGRSAAEEAGAFVPAPRSGTPWWRENPEALPPRDIDGRSLDSWAAGRVESVDADGVHVHMAETDAAGEVPTLLAATVPLDVWRRRCLDSEDLHDAAPGRFVEVGRYRGPDLPPQTVIRLLPRTRLPEPRHPPLPAARWRRP
jgi:tetratricopeptide (TPR) repeat protein